MKVKLTVYKNNLVIETVDPDKPFKDFVPNGNGKIGCVIMDTAKNIGASKEAIEWLSKVPTSRDDIGDVDSFKSGSKWVFAWLGGVWSIKDMPITGSRTFTSKFPHQTIPNKPPKDAIEAIDNEE